MTSERHRTDRVLFEEELPGGAMWSHVLRRHQTLRLIDVEGGANVGVLLYNRDLPLERYNMPDTLKAQHTAFLTAGRRALLGHGAHPLLDHRRHAAAGTTPSAATGDAARRRRRSTATARYQEQRNDYHRNAHDSFLVELGKWGLGKRDLRAQPELLQQGHRRRRRASCSFVPGTARPAAYVDLRAEMNVLVVLNTCPHPLDPAPQLRAASR